MENILRVNMDTQTISSEPAGGYELWGGRGLIAKILNDEVDASCDPLGRENKLIIAPGLLTGTAAPCTGRLSVGGKSPLTGTIKEANSGGIVPQMLAKLNIKAIVVEGMPQPGDWYILRLTVEKAELLPAAKYVGMNNYELTAVLQKEYGEHIGIVSIGGAGEKGYKNSTVQVTSTNKYPSRSAARGGLGALMGSKGIKAVVVDVKGPANPSYLDKEKFISAAQSIAEVMKAVGKGMAALGTASLVNVINSRGALPTRNFSSGNFEQAELISGEHIAKLQSERGGKNGHACHHGCVIGCSNIYHDEKGQYLTAGLEYETIGLVGSNCGISSIDIIATIDRMCDDFGLDTMETGATIGVCMEAGKLSFGDGEGAINLIKEMMAGTEFGQVLGQGTEYAGKALGVKRIPTVKGQSLSAYDPRAIKGIGVTYATCPMGADHTAGNTMGAPLNHLAKDGQVQVSTMMQMRMATFDTLGFCLFSTFCTGNPANLAFVLEMMAGKFGGAWDDKKLFDMGMQTLSLEKAFNKKAGFTAADDKLPDFMYHEPQVPHNTVFDLTEDDLSQAIPY